MYIPYSLILAFGPAMVWAQCIVTLPKNPLSAQGLATPFEVTGCNQSDPGQTSFAQGAIFDPATNTISIYNPLLINAGTQPAVMPTPPNLPDEAVVALWFGTNSDTLTLAGDTAKCVNGLQNSIFGQVAFCRAKRFFRKVNNANVTITAPGMTRMGMPCPTLRSFGIVDMDQSDNVVTTYLLTPNGQLAQDTAANRAALGPNVTTLMNGSDNLLVSKVLPAIGCSLFMAPDMADNGNMLNALPLNELQAAAFQTAPMALVPIDDPMVLVDGQRNLTKANLYRSGVNQPPAVDMNAASTTAYCQNLATVAPTFFLGDFLVLQNQPSLDPAAGNNLFTFLGTRFSDAFGADGLNCAALLNITSPVAVMKNSDGVATQVMVNGTPVGTQPGMSPITVITDANGVATQVLVNGIPIGNATATNNTATMAATAMTNNATMANTGMTNTAATTGTANATTANTVIMTTAATTGTANATLNNAATANTGAAGLATAAKCTCAKAGTSNLVTNNAATAMKAQAAAAPAAAKNL
jgi:hypothetical protein